MKFKERTLDEIANMICGNGAQETTKFQYRSSSYLTRFFRNCDLEFVHEGQTRDVWVADRLREILSGPQTNTNYPPEAFLVVIQNLMDKADARNEEADRPDALAALNISLMREGFQAFYAEDGKCHLRHVATNSIASSGLNPHRPFSASELVKREKLTTYLDNASEDALIEEVLLPLFRQLGFHRITAAGHKDKALEYGKDIWMKFLLPTQHVLYFGLQVKKGKIDSSGVSKPSNINVAEIYNQVTMMLGHEIFDPEIGKRVLVDHAFIVAGGEITKAARNWLGNKLDATKRSQVMFIDRDDILNLFVVTTLSVPGLASVPKDSLDDTIPF